MLKTFALGLVIYPVVALVLYGAARLIAAAIMFFIPEGRLRRILLHRDPEMSAGQPPNLAERSSLANAERWLYERLMARAARRALAAGSTTGQTTHQADRQDSQAGS
ncbi:MAG TPA: hypothetical protein VF217_03595 [Rhodanobacteraceae bacterium]